jgi:hypothetical protein
MPPARKKAAAPPTPPRARSPRKAAAPKPPAPELVAKVLELARAAAPLSFIAQECKLADADAAKAVLDYGLSQLHPAFRAELEVERLDRLHMALWPKASRGDMAAVDRVLKIAEQRQKVLAEPRPNDHAMRKAYDESVDTSKHLLSGVDAALVASGRAIADRVDEALASGDGTEVTKALYLVPHMLNILREMLATPSARINANVADKGDGGGKLGQLRAIRGRSTG